MKIMIQLLKPFSFAPAIAMMILIYSFSAQDGHTSGSLSYKVSYKIVEAKDRIMNTRKSETQLAEEANSIHHYVRKAAHMTEYFVLALCVSFPLYVYGVHGLWLILIAGFICVGYAGLDEYHQSFVANRGPSIKDVGIDSIGALAGVLIVQAFCWSVTHSPEKKRRR